MLADGPHRPRLVLTRPDRPSGRGRRVSSPPIAATARALGIDLLQPAGVNRPETLEVIAAADPKIVVVCAFGALIKEPLLSRWLMLNVHPSLLPRWRGAAPIERAIMAWDRETGVSIMRLTAGLDSGPVCMVAREPIEPRDTYGSLAGRLEEMAGRLLGATLDRAPEGLAFAEQDEEGATYAEKITAADRELDPARPALVLERTVRALHPHIGARLALQGGGALGVLEARALPEGPPAGRLAAYDGELLLGTVAGALQLITVKPAGGRAMAAEAYLRGHAL